MEAQGSAASHSQVRQSGGQGVASSNLASPTKTVHSIRHQLAVACVKRGGGRVWSARGLRAGLDLVEPYLSRRWIGLGAHTDICDLVIMIMGQLASFGLPWWRRAGRQTRSGVTPKGCPP